MTSLEFAAGALRAAGIPHALIGAAALAAHGVSRSTFDQDVLVTDRSVLSADFWDGRPHGTSVDVRRGDADDPLAGVVRLRAAGERDVDVIVGRHAWQADIVGRAEVPRGGLVPVVRAADLVMLKLYAGGSQDRWDIEQLLALDASGAIAQELAGRLDVLPVRAREIWTQLRTQR